MNKSKKKTNFYSFPNMFQAYLLFLCVFFIIISSSFFLSHAESSISLSLSLSHFFLFLSFFFQILLWACFLFSFLGSHLSFYLFIYIYIYNFLLFSFIDFILGLFPFLFFHSQTNLSSLSPPPPLSPSQYSSSLSYFLLLTTSSLFISLFLSLPFF